MASRTTWKAGELAEVGWTVMANLCDAMRCDAMRCDAMRCDAMLCYAMLCCAVLCYAMRCDAMLGGLDRDGQPRCVPAGRAVASALPDALCRIAAGGGYAYRLAPADGPLTEEAFRKIPLDFVGPSALRWDGDTAGRLEFDAAERGWETNVGTVPVGSYWCVRPPPAAPRARLRAPPATPPHLPRAQAEEPDPVGPVGARGPAVRARVRRVTGVQGVRHRLGVRAGAAPHSRAEHEAGRGTVPCPV